MSGVARAADERERAARALVAPFAHLFPWEPRFLALEHGAMHYVDEGPRDGEPILCVHGNPTWSFAWRALVAELGAAHRVIAADHLGCGLSDKPARAPYDLAFHVANLERLVLALDLRGVTLVVHDWGGAIGMGVAARQPERIARIAITNSAAFPAGAMPARIALARTPLAGEIAVRGANLFARAATRMAVERPLAAEVRAAYLAPYRSWRERVAIWRFVRDIPTSPAHPSFALLCAIGDAVASFARTPALLVWGERDWCFTPHFRRLWQERLPQAEAHRLDRAGHWVFEDEPEALVRALAEWLARTPAGAGSGA